MAEQPIRFLLNNEPRTISQCDPNTTVLNYLRQHEGRTGTKEGCASGDCGACTVVVRDQEGQYQTLNACITFLPALHGKQLITVEDLAHDGTLHPVQQALIDEHGTQCGFCTPGFVMSSFALHKEHDQPTDHQVMEALAGNLCRCTGYRSIIDAARQPAGQDQFDQQNQTTLDALEKLNDGQANQFGLDQLRCDSPTTVSQLAQLLQDNPKARLLAGGTDLALEVTQQLRQLDHIIYLGHLAELKTIEDQGDHWLVGSAVTYTTLKPILDNEYPELGQMIERLGSLQVRNQGTLGGNIGNASPIGDMPPPFIALNAELILQQGDQQRSLPIADFFKDYKVTDLQPGEFIRSIKIPKAKPNHHLFVYKISKRLDDDISAVLAAFHFSIEDGKVAHFNTGFGGMAGIPKAADQCQKALLGQTWSQATIEQAMELEQLYTGDLFGDRGFSWAWGEMGRLSLMYTELVQQLCGALLDKGDSKTAIRLLKKLIARNELDEEPRMLLMRALAYQKNKEALNRQYHEFRETLKKEIGVSPSLETVSLYAELMAGMDS